MRSSKSTMKSLVLSLLQHTCNEVLHSMSTYVQKLIATIGKHLHCLHGTRRGGAFGPVYWFATSRSKRMMLKMDNYNGEIG
jgi:alpha-N-arabinofuranosidase